MQRVFLLLAIISGLMALTLFLSIPYQQYTIKELSIETAQQITHPSPAIDMDAPYPPTESPPLRPAVTESLPSFSEKTQQLISYELDETTPLTIQDILSAKKNKAHLPVIGLIDIPAVDLSLPIMAGVGKVALAAGAGTLSPTQKMGEGNYALASHYYERKRVLFGPLYDVALSDRITITDGETTYEYAVFFKEIVKATDTHLLANSETDALLTLITCANNGKKRLIIQAKRIH